MSALKFLLPAIIAFAAVPSVSEAQYSTPFVIKTYKVQVQYEMWRNGGTYWATEFETDDQEDAQMMFLALETALDNGYICQILDCDFDYIVRDVRLVVEYKYAYVERRRYDSRLLYQQQTYLTR